MLAAIVPPLGLREVGIAGHAAFSVYKADCSAEYCKITLTLDGYWDNELLS
jgi:hypothetical protein